MRAIRWVRPIAVLLALLASGTGSLRAAEFYFDFRGKPLPPDLEHYQARPDIIKEEAAGLRITIPDTWQHAYGGTGVRTKFGLKGDFEVTTTFEIITADLPEKGYGVGVCLRVVKAEPSKEVANWNRLVRPNGAQVLHWE